MATANRVDRLVIKFKRRIRPVVIDDVVSWLITENGILNCTTLNGGKLIPLKNFVSIEYIKK